MAESSSSGAAAGKAPASQLWHPASPQAPPTDERNDEVAGDEAAPLLESEDTPSAPPVTSKFIRILTLIAITSSVVSLLVLFATAVVDAALPYGGHIPWETRTAMTGVVIPVIETL